MAQKSTIYFYRDYAGFTGGHLKVWDYFQHARSSGQFNAEIFFTPKSSWVNNPWYEFKEQCLPTWNPEKADILFLAGLDWLALTEQQRLFPPAPVVNFIQSVRHADKANQLFDFLKFPAIRICVSQEVSDAINNTGVVNGPVIVNTNGIDHSLLSVVKAQAVKDIPLLIVGNKNPELAKKLSARLILDGLEAKVLIDHVSRNEFLSFLNRAEIALFLPVKNEGFYLPALEAMYLYTFVICPDCIGNRSFCVDNVTCLRPDYEYEHIRLAMEQALSLHKNQRKAVLENAYNLAKNSTLQKEREVFLRVMSEYFLTESKVG